MKLKKILFILVVLFSFFTSTYILADNYVFRIHMHGIKSSGSLSIVDDIPETPPNETDNSCYNPINIGTIGNASGCSGMLIVNRAMLYNAVNNNYTINHEGIDYTFSDSENNIFTGQVTDMTLLFDDTYFNGNIAYWDTSNVTSMHRMFRYARNFNQDISNWNVSNVTDMSYMFYEAGSFNQNLNNWDTSSLVNMQHMFYYASGFNGNISNWNTSSVTNMQRVFYRVYNFNQDISNWNTSNVTDMSYMFFRANSFNQNISQWDTSNVTDVYYMFGYAWSFNQDLSSWCFNERPFVFDEEANSWILPKPTWGSCS